MPDGRLATSRRWLLYDGDCGFCRRWCTWAIRRGANLAVTFEPCRSAIELRIKAGVSEQACSHTAVFIECNHAGGVEHVATGASAINSVLAHLPGSQNFFYRWLSHLYDVPGVHQIEDLGYRLIARHRGSFDKASCGPDD